jgi:hypothetical protein
MKTYWVRLKDVSGYIFCATIQTFGDIYDAVQDEYPGASPIGADAIKRIA